jgi:hypothetical protein
VLLDVMMPSMSGYEVAARLRQSYPSSLLPIMMVSANFGCKFLAFCVCVLLNICAIGFCVCMRLKVECVQASFMCTSAWVRTYVWACFQNACSSVCVMACVFVYLWLLSLHTSVSVWE